MDWFAEQNRKVVLAQGDMVPDELQSTPLGSRQQAYVDDFLSGPEL